MGIGDRAILCIKLLLTIFGIVRERSMILLAIFTLRVLEVLVVSLKVLFVQCIVHFVLVENDRILRRSVAARSARCSRHLRVHDVDRALGGAAGEVQGQVLGCPGQLHFNRDGVGAVLVLCEVPLRHSLCELVTITIGEGQGQVTKLIGQSAHGEVDSGLVAAAGRAVLRLDIDHLDGSICNLGLLNRGGLSGLSGLGGLGGQLVDQRILFSVIALTHQRLIKLLLGLVLEAGGLGRALCGRIDLVEQHGVDDGVDGGVIKILVVIRPRELVALVGDGV